MEKFASRDWMGGDIYSPHDLSPAQMRKWRKRHSPNQDIFDAVDINPLDLYKVRVFWEKKKKKKREEESE